MVDLLLFVIDKLLSLLQSEKRPKQSFTEFVDPIFDKLLLVHSDYVSMFREMEFKVDSLNHDFQNEEVICDKLELQKLVCELIDFLSTRRLELLPLRTQINCIMTELENHKGLPNETRKFAIAVTEYLPTSDRIERLIASCSQRKRIVDRYLETQTESAATSLINELDHVGRSIEVDDSDSTRPITSPGLICDVIRATIEIQGKKWSRLCEIFAKLKVAALRDG